MYFWKIEDLKNDIVNNNLSEKDKLIYLLIFIVPYTAMSEIMSFIPTESPNIWDFSNAISSVLVVLVGTIIAFQANSGKNGSDFLGRYFSISFVLGVRLTILFSPLMIILSIYYFQDLPRDGDVITSPASTVLGLAFSAIYYWRLYKHISDVRIDIAYDKRKEE